MKAIIPVAGTGSRLRPFTATVPKPLLPVAGKPILAHILDNIIASGVDEVILIIGYKGEKIREYVERNYSIRKNFVEQKELLGLGYAVRLGLDFVDNEPVLVALGDTIVELGLGEILRGDRNIIGVRRVEDPRRFGVVELEKSRIIRLEEKPEHPASDMAITSPYFFTDSDNLKASLDEIIGKKLRTRGEYQLTDAIQLMVAGGEKIFACEIKGWFDCGTVETLIETNRHLLKNVKSTPEAENAVIVPPVYIGKGATVERSVIGPFVSIGEGAEVRDSVIADSIIGDGAIVERSLLRASILGNRSIYRGQSSRMILGDHSEGGQAPA